MVIFNIFTFILSPLINVNAIILREKKPHECTSAGQWLSVHLHIWQESKVYFLGYRVYKLSVTYVGMQIYTHMQIRSHTPSWPLLGS